MVLKIIFTVDVVEVGGSKEEQRHRARRSSYGAESNTAEVFEEHWHITVERRRAQWKKSTE